jgi:peptidoglycan hydrolase-like protein with peptidoglycan-binding domain
MVIALSRAVFASVLVLTFVPSGWAAEEKQMPPAKAEKMAEMEKKPEMAKMKGMEEHRKLQEALKAKGNDPGPIDGRMGPKTRAALKAFQEANGLKVTVQLDDQTAEKLGLEKSAMPRGKEMKPMTRESKEPMSQEPPMTKEKK